MRAANLFDQIIIAIAANPSKQPLFDLETRIALTQDIFKNKPNISAEGFTGLMVDFAKEQMQTWSCVALEPVATLILKCHLRK